MKAKLPGSVLVMYSKEFEHVGLCWRVEAGDHIYYVKHADIEVPSKTFHRPNATPAYVLKCHGLVQYSTETQSLKII